MWPSKDLNLGRPQLKPLRSSPELALALLVERDARRSQGSDRDTDREQDVISESKLRMLACGD